MQGRWTLAALIGALLAPAPAAAATPAYATFRPSDTDYATLTSDAFAACMDASGGVTSSMRDCSATEHELLDLRLNAAYRAAMARLPGQQARNRLRALERQWLRTRWDECRDEAAPEAGGTMSLLIADNCGRAEMMRRILWLERYGR